jgi:hypothetical protein
VNLTMTSYNLVNIEPDGVVSQKTVLHINYELENLEIRVRFGDLTKETYVTPCILVNIYTHFGGTWCLISSSLRTEAGHSFNTIVNIYRTTRRQIL